jgi:hypothetical protein
MILESKFPVIAQSLLCRTDVLLLLSTSSLSPPAAPVPTPTRCGFRSHQSPSRLGDSSPLVMDDDDDVVAASRLQSGQSEWY